MNARRRDRWKGVAAALLPLLAILAATWQTLDGTHGVGSETAFDLYDPLFGNYRSTPPRAHDDSSPVQYDWPRDKRLIERVHQGHFDLWNPLPGNGTPLPPDPGGLFSPLRLFLYAAPLSPYTAFVLFRVARLLVCALGAYLLGRRYALSRPASALVAVAMGLAGGMISQLPFATPQSVCWLPWVCWAQVRLAQKRSWGAVVPVGLLFASMVAGGHQPIVASMVVGAIAHGAAVIMVQPNWRTRARVAALLGVGYVLALLLAAPAVLASAELVSNGHSYKLGDVSRLFREGALIWNRGVLFPGAVLPLTMDALRDRGAPYPYVLHFSCGVLTYLLAAVTTVSRRWRFEWLVLLLVGVALCFQPPGFAWLAKTPFIKDILPRYTWLLCVLPLCLAGGAGVDALAAAARSRRGRPPVPARAVPGPGRGWRRLGPVTMLIAALALFAGLGGLAAQLMWIECRPLATALRTFVDSGRQGKLMAAGALAVALIALAVAVALMARGIRAGRWVLAVAACVEVMMIARPHLAEPVSQQVRRPLDPEVVALARTINREHARGGGSAATTIGFGGWPDVRAITPLSPRRYARFLEAASGPIYWTVFNVPGNRSALADLASVGYLVVPKSPAPLLEEDPQVVSVATIKGVSVYHNQAALPRARVVHQTILASSIDDAVARLSTLTRGAVHVGTTPLSSAAILEAVPGAAPPRLLNGGPPTAAAFVADDADTVVLKVDSPEAGYVVLADTHYPGWRATVDDHAQPIYPANVGFRAVYVGPGQHTVTFRYQPLSFRLGMTAAILGLLACALIMVFERAQGRKRRLGVPPLRLVSAAMATASPSPSDLGPWAA